jgi:hypothetical protein
MSGPYHQYSYTDEEQQGEMPDYNSLDGADPKESSSTMMTGHHYQYSYPDEQQQREAAYPLHYSGQEKEEGEKRDEDEEEQNSNNNNNDKQKKKKERRKGRANPEERFPRTWPKRVDFRKLRPRRQLKAAQEKLNEAEQAASDAREVMKLAQQELQTAESALKQAQEEFEQVNHEVVDDLLEMEHMRPWQQWYRALEDYKNKYGTTVLAPRPDSQERLKKKLKKKQSASATAPGEKADKSNEEGDDNDDDDDGDDDNQPYSEYRLGAWCSTERCKQSNGKLELWKKLALDRLGRPASLDSSEWSPSVIGNGQVGSTNT